MLIKLCKSFQSQFMIIISPQPSVNTTNKIKSQIFIYVSGALRLRRVRVKRIYIRLFTIFSVICYKICKTSIEFIRLSSPILDSYIFSQYLNMQVGFITFNKIVKVCASRIGNRRRPLPKRIKRRFKRTWNKTPFYSQVRGIILTIKGRIPLQSVRPRKTVQEKIVAVGRARRKTSSSLVIIKKSCTTATNPQLGSYSIWVRSSLKLFPQDYKVWNMYYKVWNMYYKDRLL